MKIKVPPFDCRTRNDIDHDLIYFERMVIILRWFHTSKVFVMFDINNEFHETRDFIKKK